MKKQSATDNQGVIGSIQKLLADRTIKKIVIIKDRTNQVIKIVGRR